MAEFVTSEKIKSSLLGWAQSFHRLAHMAEETERAARVDQPEPGRGGAADPSDSAP
jgi:hypothetical protein